MQKAHSSAVLKDLRQKISRIEGRVGQHHDNSVLPFKIDVIDRHLPQKGLTLGALHEVRGAHNDSDEAAAALFTAGIMARTPGYVVWCVTSFDLFIHGLANAGLTNDRIIFVEAHDEKTVFLVMEEALRHAGLAGVVGEAKHLPPIAARRLHLASRTSGVTALFLRRLSRFQKILSDDPATAVTRWRIEALPSSPLPVAGIGRARWKIELMRCRDAETAEWIMEACDASGYLALPSHIGDRSHTVPKDWRLSA